ncbi:uncharacterized protein [Physcomitrium patens]|uniref:uncharacterized protein n=1 Tax=Physcomitrium patens TaxID=3218 RepID=UPI003CCCE5C6
MSRCRCQVDQSWISTTGKFQYMTVSKILVIDGTKSWMRRQNCAESDGKAFLSRSSEYRNMDLERRRRIVQPSKQDLLHEKHVPWSLSFCRSRGSGIHIHHRL